MSTLRRILFVSHLYPSAVRPLQATYNRALVAAMRRAGVGVEVIAPVPWFPLVDRWLRRRRPTPRNELIDDTAVHHPRFLYTPGTLIRHHWRFYRWSVRRAFLRAAAGSVVDHCIVGFAYPDAVALGPVCRAAGLPYSVLVLGSDFRVRIRQPGFRGLVMRTLQEAPLIFCPGQALKRDMAAAGIDAGKIVPFSNGVDSALFGLPATPPDSPGPKTVLFVGNLLPVKGLDRLLAAWRLVLLATDAGLRSSLVLAVIGDGPGRADLQNAAKSQDLCGTVRFLGPQPREAVARHMQAAHCLCSPSRSEGMPNVVVEALACGLPAVATSVGETPFLVKPGENGLLVADAHDATVIPALAQALREALSRDWDPMTVSRVCPASSWDEAAQVVLAGVRRTSSRVRPAGP